MSLGVLTLLKMGGPKKPLPVTLVTSPKVGISFSNFLAVSFSSQKLLNLNQDYLDHINYNLGNEIKFRW